jgi:signal transduction histidine kinase
MAGALENAIAILEYGVALNAVENPENNYAINISLGATYFENGNRDKAVRQLWRAKDFEPYSSSMYYRAILNNYMGILYYSERAYEEAGHHFTLAIKQLTSSSTHTMQEFWLQNILNNLGLINFHMRNFDKARNAYKLAKIAAAYSNNPDALGNTYLNMGRLEKLDSNYEAALSFYKIAERYFKFNNESQLNNRIYNLLTEIYIMLGRPKDAEEHLAKITDSCFWKTDDVYFRLEHPRIRSLLAVQQGNSEEALKWKTYYVQITDSLNKNLFRDKIRVESARLELEREKGNRKSAEQELALIKTRNRLAILGFIALITIAAVLYLFAYQVRKKNKALLQLSRELRTKERKLNEMNKELSAANQHKNLILSTVAHDLRNLLSNVIQVSRLLHQQRKNLSETEKNMELLPFVIRSARMGLFTIQDLLEATQPSRELKIQRTPILPKNIINEALELLGNRAREKQVRIKVHDSCQTFFRGDQEKIIRCMLNLIENALKFSDTGKVIHLGCKDVGDFVQFFVVDRGIGIPENQINKLFKPFSKGQDGTQGESSTGLGLFIVRGIVSAHRGKIKFYSKPGKGTHFYLFFPK